MHIPRFCSKFSIKAEVPGNFSRMMHDQNCMSKMMKVCNRTKRDRTSSVFGTRNESQISKRGKITAKIDKKKRKTDYLERKNQRSDFENEKKRGEMGKALDAA